MPLIADTIISNRCGRSDIAAPVVSYVATVLHPRPVGTRQVPAPQLDAKVRDVVGLYLNPPQNAVVVCVDEKTQVQALDRTAPILPLRPGLPEKATHDYVRHGTTSLFAALEVATGKVTDAATSGTPTSSSSTSSSRSRRPTRG